jgi:predicted nucleic acid-binding protein
MVAPPLYVDSSSVIRIALGDHDGGRLDNIVYAEKERGSVLLSSQLLELECRRTSTRLALAGLKQDQLERFVIEFDLLPIDDDVWRVAMGISQPIKTLDSIHLATCLLVPDVQLLTSDKLMRQTALELGISVISPAIGW